MSDEAPYIHRPVPRRPFELGLTSPTPSESDSPSLCPTDWHRVDQMSSKSPFLDPNSFQLSGGDSISRNASYRALTGSTLSGIYSPGITGYAASSNEDAVDDDISYPAVRRGSVDEQMYLLMRGRQNSLLMRRRSSALSTRSGQSNHNTSTWALGLRTALLYALGMAYGALLTRLSTEQKWTPMHMEAVINPTYDGRYLAAWGLFGVVLGSLLPWFDGKWEKIVDKDDEPNFDGSDDPGTDWALVVRGIGAFAGIVFAIVGEPQTIAFVKVDY